MAFNKDQLRELIEDVLRETGMYSDSAVELLMLTCAVESNLGTYIKQVRGPALGIFQMEPNTHDDIWKNYLRYNQEIAIRTYPYRTKTVEGFNARDLKTNLAYMIVMARIHYLRVPEPLPPADNIAALAMYWKVYYNTMLGKGTVKKAVQKYEEYAI